MVCIFLQLPFVAAHWTFVDAGQEFRVSVTFVPHTSTEPLDHGTEVVGTGSNIYRRVISFEKKGTRLELTGESQ
jgi:hypothetical protein